MQHPQNIRFLSIVFAIAVVFVGLAGFVGTMLSDFTEQSTEQTNARVNLFLPPDIPDAGWTTIRGPFLDGHSPEIHLADNWPSDGPPLL